MKRAVPPRAAERVLEWLLPPAIAEALLGDLAEEFNRLDELHGIAYAHRWYRREVLRTLLALVAHPRSLAHRASDDRPPDRTEPRAIMSRVFADVRYAARLALRRPAYSGLIVATLAVGIGASTAIFSAVNPVLFESLPYPHAAQLVTISDINADGTPAGAAFATYHDLAASNHSFDAIAALKSWQPTVTGPAEPERLSGQRVTANYFHVLGVAPALGRDFTPADDVNNGPAVVILSDGLWRRRFGADPSIVNRNIMLNGTQYTVLGIMPAGFENVLSPESEIWGPLQYDLSLPWACRTCHHLRAIGRLRPAVTKAQALVDLDRLSHTMVQAHPTEYGKEGFILTSLQDEITAGVRPALLAVLAAVLLVLLIACANVTGLLLMRSEQRRGEFAIRIALGAARHRVITQLLTESLLLAAAGGVFGLLLANTGVHLLVAFSPSGMPRLNAITINAPVFGFTLALTTIVGLVFGVGPAWHASRSDLYRGLQHAGRRTAGGAHPGRNVLVVFEVALALVLLVGSGLLLRSLDRLFAVAPGFEPAHLLTMQVQESGPEFADNNVAFGFFDQALDAVRHVPGVESAAWTSQLPLSGDFDGYGTHFESKPRANPEDDPSAFRYAVSPGYFETMRIPLRRGRLLDRRDVTGSPLAVVINESFAQRVLPGENPIGQRLKLGGTNGAWYTIVGVAGNVKQTSLAATQSDAAYITARQWQFGADNPMTLVVRTRSDPGALATAVRRAIWSVDRNQPISRVATMSDLVASTAAERHFVLTLFSGFALVALLLAAAGIYGVLAATVTERTREIGVRSALGATRRDILTLVVRQGMVLTATGLILGVAGALMSTRALSSLLFGVSHVDPITYLGVVVLLAAVAAGACLIPARRAAKVDPVIALRAD